jgi:hypothetical protein
MSGVAWAGAVEPANVHRGEEALQAEQRRADHALNACGCLARRAVLVVPGAADAWSVLERASAEGAMVTAVCSSEQAPAAWRAGAAAVMDPARRDPTWYRNAWSMIYDPEGRLGYRRAARALDDRGVYVTSRASLADHGRALLARLTGGPRLLVAR